MKELTNMFFVVLLLAAAPVLIVLDTLMPEKVMSGQLRREREARRRAEVVAACETGSVEQVEELVRRWQFVDFANNRPREALMVLRAYNLPPRQKLEIVARLATEP